MVDPAAVFSSRTTSIGTRACLALAFLWQGCLLSRKFEGPQDTSAIEDDADTDADMDTGTDSEGDTDTDSPDDDVCQQGSEIPSWSLGIDSRYIADGYATMEANGHDTLVPCTLEVDGTSYEGCEARLLGETSFWFDKKSFRIEFPEGSDHPGYTRKINLRAEYNDPTLMRNHLAYEAFRHLTSIPTPCSRYTSLYMNGVYFGLMLEVEHIGDSFLETRGRDPKAPMYEADPPQALFNNGACALIPLPDEATYRAAYDKKSGKPDTSYDDLIALIQDTIYADHAEGPHSARIAEAFDVDGYFDYLALMALINDHDSIQKNYYLSLQYNKALGDDRWEIYPWDLDLSFGCIWNTKQENTLCDDGISWTDSWVDGSGPEYWSATYPTSDFNNLLIHQVLWDTEKFSNYKARICSLLSSSYWTKDLPTEVDATQVLIGDSLAKEPVYLLGDTTLFPSQVADIHAFLEERTKFLDEQVGCPAKDVTLF